MPEYCKYGCGLALASCPFLTLVVDIYMLKQCTVTEEADKAFHDINSDAKSLILWNENIPIPLDECHGCEAWSVEGWKGDEHINVVGQS